MRRVALSVLVLLVFASTLAAGSRNEDLCFVTVGGVAAETCDQEGVAYDITFEAFEPTMGSDHEGNLYFATTPAGGVALGWEASIGASFDRGESWVDIRPNTAGINTPPETNDPYAYVDPGTGRVFAFHMGPILTCSILSWTDDKGATWETSPVGCAPTGVWDHQTMVAARPVDGVTTFGYPNVLVQCVNAIYAAECGRSLDGGLTWQHTVPVHLNTAAVETTSTCGAQHGHLAADHAGNIYLPTSECGTGAYVHISRDSGLTWERRVISPDPTPFSDPAVAVDAEGTIYAVWSDFAGAMQFARSTDGGDSWTDPIRVTPPSVTGKLPTMVSGDKGRIAFAFIGTDDYGPRGYEAQAYSEENEDGWFADELEFGGWLSYSLDADSDVPTFTTIEATGTDPLMRGNACTHENRCGVVVDFIGSTVTPDGRIYASVIDGCLEACDRDTGNDVTGRGNGVVIHLPGVDLCETTCPRFPAGSGEAIDNGLVSEVPTSFGRAIVAPNWELAGQLNPTSAWTLSEMADLRREYNLEREEHFGRAS